MKLLASLSQRSGIHLGSPFTMCTIGCMELMSLAAQGENKQVLYFIEEGNEFAGELRHFLNSIKDNPKLKAGYAMAGADTYKKEQVIQLQAADLLSWEFQRSFHRERWTKSVIALSRGLPHQVHGYSLTSAKLLAFINSANELTSNRKKC